MEYDYFKQQEKEAEIRNASFGAYLAKQSLDEAKMKDLSGFIISNLEKDYLKAEVKAAYLLGKNNQ